LPSRHSSYIQYPLTVARTAAFGLRAAGFDLFPSKLPIALFLRRLCAAPPVSPNFHLTVI